MKKVLILSAITISVSISTAYALTTLKEDKNTIPKSPTTKVSNLEFDILKSIRKNENFDFVYKIQNRFNATLTKSQVQHATSIIDLVPKKETEYLIDYKNVVVAKTILVKDKDVEVWGENEILNENQKNLLSGLNYSDNYFINADCLKKYPHSEISENYELVYYLTVVPEQEAYYSLGHDALIDYLKSETKKLVLATSKNDLKPGRINFSISPKGKVESVSISSSCNYPEIDKKMENLMNNLPGTWMPAKNAEGENIAQQLVFFYGIEGC